MDEPVGVATHLAVVRQPAVGPLDGPTHAERDGELHLARAGLAAPAGDDQVVDAEVGAQLAGDAVVVAAVEMERLDVEVQSAALDRVEGGF